MNTKYSLRSSNCSFKYLGFYCTLVNHDSSPFMKCVAQWISPKTEMLIFLKCRAYSHLFSGVTID